jgi:UV excision repair protein RAD23
LIQETTNSELPASTLKLIHSGKVLKDEDTIASCSVKENDFLVVMVTKPKKPAAVPAAAAAATPTPPTPAAVAATETKTPAATAPAAEAVAPAAPARDEFPSGALESLVAMGFPEPEVRHCLRAASGNPDIAVEFLTNGIPDGMQQAAALATGGAATPAASSGSTGTGSTGPTLQALRNHAQFADLRRLVQSNPQMLQQVLTQIGQQQPDLLAEINANQALFLQMMNEPVTAAPSSSGSSPAPPAGDSAMAGAGMMEGMGNPAQMAQMIQGMSSEELNQMAAMMGLSPDQLRTTAQMIGQMPPEQLSQFMMQAMGGEGMAGMMGGAGGGAGGGGGGQQVLHLTEEEMAAVDRLADMGFDRSEAAQAYLACDKNEALAANLLMDGGFGFGTDDSGGGGGSNGNGGADDNDDDAMYD